MGRKRSSGRRSTRRRPRTNPYGILQMQPAGYGFVQTAEGMFYIATSHLGGAFDGDYVEIAPIRPVKSGNGDQQSRVSAKKPPARVVRVIDRTHDTILGRYEIAEPFGVVVPQDKRIPYDIFTIHAEHPDIAHGSLVRVRIVDYPTRHSAASGVIEEVLDEGDIAQSAIDALITKHKLEVRFSDASLEQAHACGVDAAGAKALGYEDITDRVMFTIDPTDAKDYDDALSFDQVERNGKPCWRLGVHIADVGAYVPWDSSLDLDARRRGTSVYLADRVIPMLPEVLSNDVCSLKPGEIRQTLSVDVYLDDQAQVLDVEFYPALIRSAARLTYDDALLLLQAATADGFASVLPERGELSRSVLVGVGVPELVARLKGLDMMAKARAAARAAQGGIDFEHPEAKVVLGADHEVLTVELRSKNAATMLVEEAMILANELVAAYTFEQQVPSLYRVHEAPAADTLSALVPLFAQFSWFNDIDTRKFVAGDTHQLQRVLALVEGRLEHYLVTSLLLRAMKRAHYAAQCEPHYGLGLETYSHFTSPIRRYPDLVVHRALRSQLFAHECFAASQKAALSWLAEHTSNTERIAETAARQSQEIKMIEYMQRFVGTIFPGTISGVTQMGLFVQLENTIEGLVSIRRLPDEYYVLDSAKYQLIGEESETVYSLGQRVYVCVEDADPATRKLNFTLSDKDAYEAQQLGAGAGEAGSAASCVE